MANINPQNFNVTGKQLASLSLKVEIPCTGHALLITDELKKDNGVKNVQFSAPNTFNVQYDKNQTSAEKIESMEIFKTYKAIIN
jgi:copper chaperone CopZ